jgi:hypothetical protein
VDSLYKDGFDDGGSLVVSFDVPTDIPPFVGASAFEPADLVEFLPTAAGVCSGTVWVIALANPVLDATTTIPPMPLSSNVDGADDPHLRWILAFDVPTNLPPALPATAPAIPGMLVEWDGGALAFSSFEVLGGWPISSIVDGVSCGGARPGRVPDTSVKLDKAVAPVGDIVLSWGPSCAAPEAAQDYQIYEGTLGTWYNHSCVVDTDPPFTLTEQITPAVGNTYYLVVPLNRCKGTEGSYGKCSPSAACGAGNERPVGSPQCPLGGPPFVTRVLPDPILCP